MIRRNLSAVLFLACAVSHSAAEAARLPFVAPAAAFSDSARAFPGFSCWTEFSHTLNQGYAPDTAHYLDAGSIMTFWSNERVAISGVTREILQFRASPEGDWYFWTRAFVTDLALEASLSLVPLEVTAGYRHDCKHDAGEVVRDVIHDALFARLRVPVADAAVLGFECEANLPTVFQAGPEESDRFRESAEAELTPFETRDGSCRAFLGGRGSLIVRERGSRVAVRSPRDFDWLARIGGEYRAGFGRLRLYYALERIGDDWDGLDPSPQIVSAVRLLLEFDAGNGAR